jgi:hypothetical protein
VGIDEAMMIVSKVAVAIMFVVSLSSIPFRRRTVERRALVWSN